MRTELIALCGLVLMAVGCSNETCIRDSDCPTGVCGAAGVCFVIEVDAGPDDAGDDAPDDAPEYRFEAVDTSDAGYRFDALDVTDGPELDAGTDAPTDASVDAPIDGVPFPEPPIFTGPDRVSL